MKVLLISDIHSNLLALESVLNHASYDEILFLGDVVDYGPSPFDTWVVLRYSKAKRLLGNHDAAAAFGTDCRSSKPMHNASIVTRRLITLPDMPESALEILGKADRKLEIDYDGFRVKAVHGAPDDALYRYVTKEEAAHLDMNGADLLLLGHTHVAYEVKNGKTWVVNPGSVGMPKDGDPRASYAVLDTEMRTVVFERVSYDIEETLVALKDLLKTEQATYELLSGILRTGAMA